MQTKDKMSNSNWSSLFTEKQDDPAVPDESKSEETLSIMETHSRYCFILHPIGKKLFLRIFPQPWLEKSFNNLIYFMQRHFPEF